MNRRQSLALRRHCRLAIETAHPDFGWAVSDLHSIVLSVNSGYE